ncbi:MAG: exo-alpha-sialidase [Clostridia bacterium]|nr:exo-alpha-sialidase [Clostridia bacterium]
MKITVKETKIICSNPDNPKHAYFAWPSVARLHDGRLAMVASGFRRRHVCPFGKVVMCQSDDEGATWSRPAVVIDTPLDDRDAGILTFGEHDVIVTSFNNSREMQRRWNRKTRDPYVEAYLDAMDAERAEERYLGSTFVISHDDGRTFSEVKRIPVTAPHGPARMPDGSLLYVGRLFHTGPEVQNNGGIAAYRLEADGSYELLGMIEGSDPALYDCEPHAIVLDDGKILVHIRVQGEGYFTTYQSESTDGGRSFTKPRRLLSVKGGAPAHLLTLADGTLISVFGYREEPYGIRVMISRDHGDTWTEGGFLYINGLNPDLGYPASVQLKNGDILTVYYAKPEKNSPAVIMQTVWHLDLDAKEETV